MPDEVKKSGLMAQIFVGIVLAACVGGSSPWWLKEIKELFASSPPAAASAGERSKPAIDDEIAKLDKDDLISRQKELEKQLEDLKRGQQSDPQSQPVRNKTHDVGGSWNGADGSTYTFFQNGNNITFEEFTPDLGKTAVGTGTISGRDMTFSVQTALFSQGTLTLRLSDDGSQMTGTYTDQTYGLQTSPVLTR